MELMDDIKQADSAVLISRQVFAEPIACLLMMEPEKDWHIHDDIFACLLAQRLQESWENNKDMIEVIEQALKYKDIHMWVAPIYEHNFKEWWNDVRQDRKNGAHQVQFRYENDIQFKNRPRGGSYHIRKHVRNNIYEFAKCMRPVDIDDFIEADK